MQELTFTVEDQMLINFTTLLQSGIGFQCMKNEPLGAFLLHLADFDTAYLSHTVQTIFLDGNAIDDFTTPLSAPHHTVALSAAMPGLAGAIFRKNSLFATLRIRSDKKNAAEKSDDKVQVSLKLFNKIAIEKGEKFLTEGFFYSGKNLLNFFSIRPFLMDRIAAIHLAGNKIPSSALHTFIDTSAEYHIRFNTKNKAKIKQHD